MIDIHPIGILIQFVNFLITLIVLNLLLLNPIRTMIRKRKELMDGKMDAIEKFTSDAENKLKTYEEQLATARKEGNDIRAGLREEAVAEEGRLLASAGADASATLKQARTEIDSQVQEAMTQLGKDVERFAAKATDKILGQA